MSETVLANAADREIINLPGEPGYARGVSGFNLLVEHAPAVVVAPRSPAELANVVRMASALGEQIRVQRTGHGALRPAIGGVLVDTRELRGVRIEPETRTAVVGAGELWSEVIAAADPHGLAPVSGSTSAVGAVGFSLGGGTGWLVRRHGLAAGSVEAAEVVTADGQVRWVDADNEPDLFWALRGGGPNLGIVTALRIRLVPTARVYAGGLYWPVEQARPVLAAFRELTERAPADLTAGFDVLHLPPDPSIPEPMRGNSFARVLLCSVGAPEETDRLLEPLRAVPGLLVDQVRPMPYREIDSVSMDPTDPLPAHIWTAMVRTFSDAVLDEIVRHSPRANAPYLVFQVRHIGGGAPPAADLRGLAHWTAPYLLHMVSVPPDQDAEAAAEELATELDTALGAERTGHVPFNFLGARDRVEDAFTPAHLTRLREVKRRYDPANVFGGDRSLTDR